MWKLSPDDWIKRKDLHVEYGGRRQGGIGPSAQSPNIFLFTDNNVGKVHGYVDGWQEDGCYHYTGEGQFGDQLMRSGNAAVLNHKTEGRSLRLFLGVGGRVKYVDEFDLDRETPFYTTDAPETGVGIRPIRSVIVFRLWPIHVRPSRSVGPISIASSARVSEVPIEVANTEQTIINPDREPYEAERREARLVHEFRAHLEGQGYAVTRLQIVPAGEAKPLFSDLYVKDISLLIEAKGSIERGAVRMALGQLLDYRRFVPVPSCAVLLPERPRPDVVDLIRSARVGLYCKSRGGFEHLPASAR